ncbi:MAG: hypothetical protein AB7O32_11045 [Vicinamibacterales bacterium]
MPLYAVIRRPGAGWRADRTLQEQAEFQPHADYMNRLYARGALVYGGFLDGGPEVLLIMRGTSPDEVRADLQGDPWVPLEILPVDRVALWTLGLGDIP